MATTRSPSPLMKRPSSQARTATTNSSPQDVYEAVVVGAGPAGIVAVGNLLEHGIEPILWVDRHFNGGRINANYREVPSNTKAKLFVDFATALAPFREIVNATPSRSQPEDTSSGDRLSRDSNGGSDKLQALRQLDQEKGCDLSYAADMCLMLTEGLKQTPGVFIHRGSLVAATIGKGTLPWTVQVDSLAAQVRRMILCTGSTPTDPPLPVDIPIKHLHLDDALSPTTLSKILSPLGPTTVAVVGASHSAVLVLRNLADLALSTKPDLKIKWFTRHPLRYAEYEEGFIALDNTGLKGEAAVWARENLEPETFPQSPISQCMTKIAYEKGKEPQVYAEHLPDCRYVVQAIGFERNRLPTLKDESGVEISPRFDHNKGTFSYGPDSATLPGLFGAGIAFPERVRDKKYGHEEMNVGFFKFMKAVKKWVPEWI